MKRPLQYLLACCTLVAAISFPALNGQTSIWVRVAGVSSGILFFTISPNVFEIINNLNQKRFALKKEVRSLESKLELLPKQLELVAKQKQEEWDSKERELKQREAQLEKNIEAANLELEQDKQAFLEEQSEVIAQYESQIELLESQLDEMRSLLAQYEAPALPEGSSFEIVIARRCMELLLYKRVVCEYKGASIDDDGYVIVRLKPQDGGQKALEKWANYLHIEMELAEAPQFATLRGAVQIWLKPQEMVRLPKLAPFDSPKNEGSPNLRLVKNEASTVLPDYAPHRLASPEPSKEFDERLEKFVQPAAKLPPYGSIRQIERDWVGWLWIYHEPPIRNQKEIIFRIWGYKSGDGDGFQSARSRLHTILRDAGITPRSWKRKNKDE